MTNRLAVNLRAAVFGLVSCTSSIGVAATAEPATGAAASANACLAAPKGAAPKGERWYYRVERASKRHCWYTRAQTSLNVAGQTLPSRPKPADIPDNTMADEPIQSSVANARAEISRVADPVAPPSPFPPTVAASPADDRSATGAQSANPPDVTLAERWSDHPNSGQPAQPFQPNAVAPAVAAARPSIAAAAASTTDAAHTPLWILLSVIGGVLALVGGATALIKRFASSAFRPRSEAIRPAARWQMEDFDAGPPIADIDETPLTNLDVPPMNWVRIARATAGGRDEQIEQLLSRSTRPAI